MAVLSTTQRMSRNFWVIRRVQLIVLGPMESSVPTSSSEKNFCGSAQSRKGLTPSSDLKLPRMKKIVKELLYSEV